MEIKKGLCYKQNNSGGHFYDMSDYKQEGIEPLFNSYNEEADLLVTDPKIKFSEIIGIQETIEDECDCCGARWECWDSEDPIECEYYVFDNQEEFKEYRSQFNSRFSGAQNYQFSKVHS